MEERSIARGIVGQARPILIGQLAAMAFAVVDTVLSGLVRRSGYLVFPQFRRYRAPRSEQRHHRGPP